MKMKKPLLVFAITILFFTASLIAKKIFVKEPQPKHSELFLQEKKRRQELVDKAPERKLRATILKNRKLLRDEAAMAQKD